MTDVKKSYHHGDLKNALLRAGIDLLEAEGMEGLSLRAIAGRVGVSHTAPKNHFGSLRGLLTAIATEGFLRHAAFMQRGVDAATGTEARRMASLTGYVAFAKAHPHLFKMMFSPEHCDFDDPDLRAAGRSSYAVLAAIAKELDWDKAEAPGGARRAEIMLWSLVHGYATLALGGQFGAGPSGGKVFDIVDIMPEFGYRDAPVG